MKYGVVIPARNESANIKYTIRSIMSQLIKPELIVVVDDNSEDDTYYVAEKEGAYVMRIKRKSNAPITATPYFAYIINKGLEILRKQNLDFIMISGADTIYPRKYVYTIIKNMIKDKVVVASGVALGERTGGILSVRGSGRIINATWFDKIGFKYPLNYGCETWLLLKALSMGMNIAVYYDVVFYLKRKTTMNPRRAYLYGKAMKSLGYPRFYSIGKIFNMFLKGRRKESLYMFIGYKKKSNIYNNIEETTKYILTKELLSKSIIKKIFNRN